MYMKMSRFYSTCHYTLFHGFTRTLYTFPFVFVMRRSSLILDAFVLRDSSLSVIILSLCVLDNLVVHFLSFPGHRLFYIFLLNL